MWLVSVCVFRVGDSCERTSNHTLCLPNGNVFVSVCVGFMCIDKRIEYRERFDISSMCVWCCVVLCCVDVSPKVLTRRLFRCLSF